MRTMSCSLLALAAIAATAHADATVIENSKTLTIDCAKDKEVNLIGNHLKVTLTGTCTKVMVTGNHEQVRGAATLFYVAGNNNTVTADATDEIYLAGNKNTVTWKKGLTKASPKISNPGKDNAVSQAR
ncbi:MAG TPA: DUF3060 domain-containing protein [Kofleriaceae bacterium]|nr:DUF3060 domain-containing protein [Kofleriaceae bacterium]